ALRGGGRALSRLRGSTARAGAGPRRDGEERARRRPPEEGDRARSGQRRLLLPALAGLPGPRRRRRPEGRALEIPGVASPQARAERCRGGAVASHEAGARAEGGATSGMTLGNGLGT